MDGQKQEFLTEKQVAALTKIALQTLRNARCQGKGIPFSKLGPGRKSSVRYLLADVLEFMESHKVVPPKVQ
jgi:hypothetical protein